MRQLTRVSEREGKNERERMRVRSRVSENEKARQTDRDSLVWRTYN